jgi:hypothetical protein
MGAALMARTYTVTTHDQGNVSVDTLTMSPEMERIFAEIEAFNRDKPDFWCKCNNWKPGHTATRGHSVDVMCANCGGYIQIG